MLRLTDERSAGDKSRMGTPDAWKRARPVWEGLCRNLPLKEGKALCFYFIR